MNNRKENKSLLIKGGYLIDRGLLEQRDVDAVIALCGDPGCTDIRSITVYAWGRKAG